MHTGMLWFDNTRQLDLGSKVERAATYYRRKYHREPTLCLVHPGALSEHESHVGPLTVRGHASVLPGHFWIGVEEDGV
jgi:hypothetical protein